LNTEAFQCEQAEPVKHFVAGGVISPLLANIVLNHLDWQLNYAGLRFVRYADDFVVLCQTQAQAKEALTLVQQVLEGRLGLQLSQEKTKVTSYGKGYAFLKFSLSSRSRRMRPKSVNNGFDAVALACLKYFIALTDPSKMVNNYVASTQSTRSTNQWGVKIDHNFSDRNKIFGSYLNSNYVTQGRHEAEVPPPREK